MADSEVVTFTGEEQINSSNIGKPNRPVGDRQAPMKSMSYKNTYVDPTRQPVHILLNDGYYGIGGFKGDIDLDDKADGTYSYQNPLGKQELQYPNRVKQTTYFNYFARFVNAKVKPVFSQTSITTETTRGDSLQDSDDLMAMFLKDCTGTGTSYKAMQEYYLTELQVHDVVYHAMTKIEGREVPSLSEYRAIDVIYINTDDNNVMNDIMLYNGTTEIIREGRQAETVTKAIRFYMNEGFCRIQHYVADKNYPLGNWSGQEDWQMVGEEKNTEVDRMVVYAQLTKAEPSGVYIPEVPRSMSLMNAQLGLYQTEGQYNWLYSIGMVPTFCMYGDMTGITLGAGAGVSIPIQNQGSQLPAPSYVSVDSSTLSHGMEKVDFNLTRLREIAKENGVDTKTGAQAQSSDSKRFEFQATEQELRRSVDYLMTADEWIFEMFNIYTGRDAYTYTRRYPETFYPEEQATLEQLVDGIATAREDNLPVTRNALIKVYVKKLTGRSLSKTESEEVAKEIDKATISAAG